MKKVLKMFSCFLMLCMVSASLTIPTFAANLYDTEEDTNSVSKNAGLAYTVTNDNTGGAISRVADRDISTKFYTSNPGYVPEFTVDLGQEYVITNFVFYGNSAWQKCALNSAKTVSYSVDGVLWDTVTTKETRVTTSSEGVEGSYYYEGIAFINQYTPEKNLTARYLKITLYDINGYNLNELTIYGADPSAYQKSFGISYSLVGVDASDRWSNVCDGKIDTNMYKSPWNPEADPQFTMDLGKVYDVSSIVSYASSGYKFGQLNTFEYSVDNTTWVSAVYRSQSKLSDVYKDGFATTNNLYTFTDMKARYVRFRVTSAEKLNIHEICVYGNAVCDEYVTYYKQATSTDNTVAGAVSFQNRTTEEAQDKCYFTVVYINGSIYKVFVNDRSTASVNSGALGDSIAFSCELPAGTDLGTVTAKTFVLQSLTSLSPVTEPLTLS